MALQQFTRQFHRQFYRPLARTTSPLDGLWHWSTRPVLLLLVALATLALVLLGLALPQLPGNLAGDATATSRWLLNTVAQMGTPGDMLRGLGLFDVLASPLLRWLLLLLAALLLLQLGQQLGDALQLQRVRRLRPDDLHAPTAAGEPVPLPVTPRYRQRSTHDVAPDVLLAEVRAALGERFTHVGEVRVQEISLDDTLLGEGADDGSNSSGGNDKGKRVEVAEEMRLLATRDLRASLLRPLLLAGGLLALAAAWWLATQSWGVVSPPLAPGDSFAQPTQNFRVQYVVAEADAAEGNATEEGAAEGKTVENTAVSEEAVPSVPELLLRVRVGDATRELPLTQAEQRLLLNGVRVRASVVSPGLLVRTLDGRRTLVTPGGSDFRSAVGLGFPSLNLEATLQQANAALLSFVRVEDDAGNTRFDVDIVAQAEAPRSLTISDAVQTLDAGSASLEIVRVPSVQVVARRTPGGWLLVPAALLVAAGFVGFWRQPAFALVQLVPWPGDRTVLVVQGSGRRVGVGDGAGG